MRADGVRYVSRVHVADVAEAISRAIALQIREGSGEHHIASVFNLADDLPAPRGEVLAYARQVRYS